MQIQSEKGFILPTLVILFLVTLALLAVGGFELMRGEGNATSEHIIAMQTDYSMQGAAKYAVARLQQGDFPTQTLNVGGVSVVSDTFDLSPANGYNPDFMIDLIATVGTISRELEVDIDAFDTDVAVWAKGSVDLITTANSGSILANWDRLGENVNSLPQIDITTLLSLPNAQDVAGGTISGTIPAGATSFLQPSTTIPWVVRYTGDVTIAAGSTFWGIMIVDGDLTIQSNWGDGITEVEGIIILANDGDDVTMANGANVDGCIICGGDVTGSGWWNEYVNHNATRMATLETYRLYPGTADGNNIVSWEFL